MAATIVDRPQLSEAPFNVEVPDITFSNDGKEEAIQTIAQHIMMHCGKMLMLPAGKFDMAGSSIASYGMDSMEGVQLKSWLFKELGLQVDIQTLMSSEMDFAGLAKMALQLPVLNLCLYSPFS